MEMDSTYDFSEDEIRAQLEKLGYHNFPHHQLKEFKHDLDILINKERSELQVAASRATAYTSEDVSPASGFAASGEQTSVDNRHVSTMWREDEDLDDDIHVHVTGTDPSTRRLPAYTTYSTEGQRVIYSAPTSPSKSTVSSTDSETERRFIKRKVCRKVNGEYIVDESYLESESDDSSAIRDRFRPLREVDPNGSDVDPRHGIKRPASAGAIPEEPYVKSVIYPMADHPHTRNLRRCDPVNRFQLFKQYWAANKVPGEKSHQSLRWNVRENMLLHDEVVKKTHRTYVPNDYVVPTDKKRQALRWQVRADMARGVKPPSGYASN